MMKRASIVMIVLLAIQLCYSSLTTISNTPPLTYSLMDNMHFVYGLNSIKVFDSYCNNLPQGQIVNNNKFNSLNFSS